MEGGAGRETVEAIAIVPPSVETQLGAQFALVVGRKIKRAPVNFKRRDFALAAVELHDVFGGPLLLFDVDLLEGNAAPV